jgi:hypothetical protein
MFRIKASQKHPYKMQLQLVGQEAPNTGILLRFHLCFNNGLYAMWHSPEVFEKVPAGQSVQLELPAIFNPNIMFMRELTTLITVVQNTKVFTVPRNGKVRNLSINQMHARGRLLVLFLYTSTIAG